ncbi:unnamed protein product [Alopecurus aequalis]
MEDKGRDKASAAEGKETAPEKKAYKKPMLIKEEPSSESGSDSDWFSQTDGEYLSEDDDDDDEYGLKMDDPQDPSVALLGNSGVISVLFETPSGFAILGHHGTRLLEPDACEHVWADFADEPRRTLWLKEFRAFEDKVSAINGDAISPAFAEMIKNHVVDGQTLAVGNDEYAVVIREHLRINFLCTPSVKELMWGLNIQMSHFVPQENSELANEDRFPMSKGMAFLLNSHNFDVEPDMMVTRRIINMASVVYECDHSVDKHDVSVRHAAAQLKKISRINTRDWDLLKLATALKTVCCPEEEIPAARRLFGERRLIRLKKDAPKYEDKILKTPCLEVYNEMYSARKLRHEAAKVLVRLLRRAKRAYQAEQAAKASGPNSKKLCHGINPVTIDEHKEWYTTLSAKRKNRQVPPILAPVDALGSCRRKLVL